MSVVRLGLSSDITLPIKVHSHFEAFMTRPLLVDADNELFHIKILNNINNIK